MPPHPTDPTDPQLVALETLPQQELERRHARCRALLAELTPEAHGLLVFSPVNLYYLTGTLGNGLLWLPREGDALLLCRKGVERARLESPLERILSFRSYGDLPGLLADAGCPLPPAPLAVAAEMGGLSWSLANLLTAKLPGLTFLPGDAVLARARSVKSAWELNKLRLAGERHDRALQELLPRHIAPGLSEREISHKAWEVFFSLGHSGLLRMSTLGEDLFLGHVSAGDSATYPGRYNGPVSLRGEHPAVPFMGYAGRIWQRGEPLACDIGFCLEGYQTDKTQLYWGGARHTLPEHVARAHRCCVEVQELVAEGLRPGARPSELYAAGLALVERAGLSEGFMGLGSNKVPFLGHGIGLAIDEYPVLAKGFDAPLEEGMVLALEPKMGLPGLGMVGVENTFEVTPQGGRCLTGHRFEIICLE